MCEAGQLIYVEPRTKHTLHAVGDEPCTVYLSVTPHVEPTHTRYDEEYNLLAPQYGTWRGQHGPIDEPKVADLAHRYVAAAERLAELSEANLRAAKEHLGEVESLAAGNGERKDRIDELWSSLRPMLAQVRELEAEWNALAPVATNGKRSDSNAR